ncbi:hypothetical protein [Spirillospora sp. CA-294931]|uniref:hypothetical protein n=1 Tax=Spirillospora sp. CA-294931 TaxID=3240042 RepID=UPI003D8E7B0E
MTFLKKTIGVAAGSIVAAAGLALVSAPASAEAQKKANCVVHLSQGGAIDCYATFTEAMRDATNGRVTDAPKNARDAIKDATLTRRVNAAAAKKGAARAAAGGTAIGVELEHNIGTLGGRSWTVEADYGCDGNLAGHDWEVRDLGDSWWNDEISGATAYGHCWVRHFEHHEFGGRSSGWARFNVNLTDVGMNDMTSSIQWS